MDMDSVATSPAVDPSSQASHPSFASSFPAKGSKDRAQAQAPAAPKSTPRWSPSTARLVRQLRIGMVILGYLWILALPYEGLWKGTYIDEHSLQPGQVTMYFDWDNVYKADRYLEGLERIINGTFEERSAFLKRSFAEAGLTTGNTSSAVYASVNPPRSAGTEAILISANWESRDGGANLRGIATLLAMGDFLRGQNHWAFNFILVIGDSYLTGLSSFLESYHSLFSSVIWTGLNIDYPGHSFSHLGIFYEGLNGRLPNQDIPNSIAHIGKWAGGVDVRVHDIPAAAPEWVGRLPEWMRGSVGSYVVGARHLWGHFGYMALGRASGGHGVMAKYRIDSSTLYCTPATGPHGFHTLGRTLESTLRSLNNLLERLHASYFFYLLPSPGKFIPVGNYLPSAILLGASVVIGGLDCPQPPSPLGIAYIAYAFLIGGLCWIAQQPALAFLALLVPRPEKGMVRDSARALAHIGYGAMIPTLAMLNFPQAILLASITIAYLIPTRTARMAALCVHPMVGPLVWPGLRREWEVLGNTFWPGVYAVWVPLWVIAYLT